MRASFLRRIGQALRERLAGDGAPLDDEARVDSYAPPTVPDDATEWRRVEPSPVYNGRHNPAEGQR